MMLRALHDLADGSVNLALIGVGFHAELMEWMPPPDGIAMCQSDVRQNVTRGESIHEGS